MARKTIQDVSLLDEAEEERMLQQQLQTDLGSEDDTEQPKKKTAKKGAKPKAQTTLQADSGSEDDTEEPKKGKKRKAQGPSQTGFGSEDNTEEAKTKEPKKGKKSKPQAPLPTPESEESSGVPARIRAERKAGNQVQLLVQWKSYPDEKDWTWELESELKESVPQMVKAWKSKKSKGETEAEGVIEHTVEKIISKKMYKGVAHYLVKWEGYEKVEDRTWEPCERLAIDVPEIVEAYESRGKGNGKSKK
ncbi:hypothetical protein VTL71DRAFT_8651 [Oculimacula yallundae]|uniref:Chromo domain-containing protein n=1 Tax=Oculimacula yallundae TaxID=86028 RepID=A0ABR4CYC7_9HELO